MSLTYLRRQPAPSVDEVSPLAISQISDLFPDLSPSFIRSCLLHPAFSGGDNSAERVIGALLEDSLPDELKKERDGTAAPDGEEVPEPRQPPRVATPPPAVAPSRRNVFDDQLMAGKIRRGKERWAVLLWRLLPEMNPYLTDRSTADALLADRTFMDDSYKASIIAAAERESSDEEGEEGEAFVEDFDAGGRAFGVRDAGEDEHEESREKESRDVTPAGSGRNTPVVSGLFSLALSRKSSLISFAECSPPRLPHLIVILSPIHLGLPYRTISRRHTSKIPRSSTERAKCAGARKGSC